MFLKVRILSMIAFIVVNVNYYSCKRIQNHKKTNMQQQANKMTNEVHNNGTTGSSCYISVLEGVSLPLNNDRGGHIGGIVENRLIIAGGNRWSDDKTQKYFLNNSLILDDQKWIDGPLLPIPLAYSAFAYNNSGLYVAGGTSNGVSMYSNVFVLKSLQKDAEWEELPNLPEALGFGAAAILNDIFYICGGILNNGERTNRMWMLDLNKIESGWSESKAIPGIPRNLHTMVACDGNLYVIGGLGKDSPLSPLDDVYKFNPKKNNWKRSKNLPMKGYAWVAQPIDKTNLLITGRADGVVHSDIWLINLETMKMELSGNLILPSTTAPLIKVSDNQWWLIGGEPDSNKSRTEKVNIIKLKKTDTNSLTNRFDQIDIYKTANFKNP